jgi:hypothetical protein
MRQRFVFPLILICGLILYFPILGTGTFVLDDGDVLSQARSLINTPLRDLFLGGGTYYRPLLMLTYMLDIMLWDGHPGIMHLVNVLLHVFNSFLVYLNVSIFYPSKTGKVDILSLGAAILFLVHPVNTESINWISGRTDPLAAFFALIATYFVLSSIEEKNRYRLWFASFFILLGSMSKEVAFFCFPAFILFLLLYKPDRSHPAYVITWLWRLTAIVPFLFGGLIYFFLRSASFKQVDQGVSKVTDVEAYRFPVSVVQQFITDFGFYIKKLLVPQPLTLAIDSVHPDYFWLGLIAILLFTLMVFMRNRFMGIALLIAFTIFPALLNALLTIAWTPYAERYLYLPCAFLCIGVALPLAFANRNTLRLQKVFLAILICIFLPTTLSRNQLWARPLDLTLLTHQQTPGNPTIWSMYAVMLANQEHYNEARAEFNKVLLKHPDHLFTHESLASMEMYVDDPDAARAALERFFNGELEPDTKILQVMLESNQQRLKMARHVETYQQIRTELIETQLNLYAKDNQHERLLEVAELAILNDDFETAEENLEILIEHNDTHTGLSAAATDRLKTLTRKD